MSTRAPGCLSGVILRRVAHGVAILACVLGGIACGDAAPEEPAAPLPDGGLDLDAELQGLATGTSLFSFRFLYPDGDGVSRPTPMLLLHTMPAASACTTMVAQDSSAAPKRFSYIAIWMNQLTTGSFTVVPQELSEAELAAPALYANVRFINVDASADGDWQKAFAFWAESGSVEIAALPTSIVAWQAGEEVAGSLSVLFAARPRSVEGCSLMCDVANNCAGDCECVNLEGVASTCTLQGAELACCAPESAERLSFAATLASAQCAGLCQAPNLLEYLCADLR